MCNYLILMISAHDCNCVFASWLYNCNGKYQAVAEQWRDKKVIISYFTCYFLRINHLQLFYVRAIIILLQLLITTIIVDINNYIIKLYFVIPDSSEKIIQCDLKPLRDSLRYWQDKIALRALGWKRNNFYSSLLVLFLELFH